MSGFLSTPHSTLASVKNDISWLEKLFDMYSRMTTKVPTDA